MAFWLGLLSLFVAVAVHAASYVYDANGRLRAVTISSGDSAEYVYDALGNLYAVNTVSAGQLAIFAFTPNHGPIGQQVVISGQGFDTVPSNDTVKFNGAVTTVVSATTTQLIANVPAGATTGPISVQVGANTATSVDNFIVTSDSGGAAPTIVSFTPAIADQGASVTVAGSHFVTTAGPTQAGVDVYQSYVTPSSDSQLSFTVLPNTGSGPVTVTTPYGSVQSSTPLVVTPHGIGASNVLSTTTLTVDGPAQTIAFNQAMQYVVATFQGTAGQWLSLQPSNVTTTYGFNTSVYDGSNRLVASGSICGPGCVYGSLHNSLQLPRLVSTGTYTVYIRAITAPVQLTLALESDSWMSVDGANLAIPTTLPARANAFCSMSIRATASASA